MIRLVCLLWGTLRNLLGRYCNILGRCFSMKKSISSMRYSITEAEFLPAALALQESPPSPMPRIGGWTLSIMMVFGVIYSIAAKVDIVVVGDGIIIENSRSRSISAVATSKLLGFRVSEGDTVHKGQIIADLDTVYALAEVNRVVQELENAKLEVIKSSWLLRAIDSGYTAIPQRCCDISVEQWTGYSVLMRGALNAYQNDLKRRDAIISLKNSELLTAQEVYKQMNDVLSISRVRDSDYQKLEGQGVVSKHDALSRRQDLTEREGGLRAQVSRIQEMQNSIDLQRAERNGAVSEYRKLLLENMNLNRVKLDLLEQELIKVKALLQASHLISPVDGVIQQLSSHLVGGVVLSGSPIFVVVPLRRELIVETKILNKDVGFLRSGMDANLKLVAFPYTKYGTISAKLIRVSSDAISDQKLGLVYSVQALPKVDSIKADHYYVHLSPGLEVSLEVKTGERRLIEYFLSPLVQKTTESFRER